MCMRIAPDTADLSVRLSAKTTRGIQLDQSAGWSKLTAGSWAINVHIIPLTQIVPDIHLSTQSADLDNSLAQEVIGLSFELLLYSRLDVVIFIPHTHLDPVWGVVTFTRDETKVGYRWAYHHISITPTTERLFEFFFWAHPNSCLDSQIKCLLPDRVEVAIDGLGPLFGLPHLDSNIWIAGASFIFRL